MFHYACCSMLSMTSSTATILDLTVGSRHEVSVSPQSAGVEVDVFFKFGQEAKDGSTSLLFSIICSAGRQLLDRQEKIAEAAARIERFSGQHGIFPFRSDFSDGGTDSFPWEQRMHRGSKPPNGTALRIVFGGFVELLGHSLSKATKQLCPTPVD